MSVYSNKITVQHIFVFILLIVQCSSYNENKNFHQLTQEFLFHYFQFNPVQATLIGNHDYDDRLNNFSRANINDMSQFLKLMAQKNASIDTNKLSNHNKINYRIFSSQIKLLQFELEEWKRWEKDVTFYTHTIYDAISGLLYHSQDTTENNTRNLLARLHQVPSILIQAKNNIQSVDNLNLKTAIDHIENQKRLIAFQLSDKFIVSDALIDSLNRQTEVVVDSLESFKAFLESKKKNATSQDLTMTLEMYAKYLNLILNEKITLNELDSWINTEYQKNYNDLLTIANKVWLDKKITINEFAKNDKLIEKVNDEIEKRSLNKDEIIQYCYEAVDEIKRFIDEIWNLSLPIDYPVFIEWGEAGRINPLKLAHLERPGLLEPKPHFYCLLNPILNDDDWIQQLSMLRKYNKPALKITMMLEAIAGHYQIWFESQEEIPILAKIFPEQAFLTSWPYYLSFSMLDAGFGGYNSELRYMLLREYVKILLLANVETKYYLQQLDLLQIERSLLENKLFTKNETEKALKQIVSTPGQYLTILWGVRNLQDLEKTCRKLLGPKFNLNVFFQRTLGQGPIPMESVKFRVLTQFQSDKTINSR